ncbi:MAG: GNAT family N-acetyltransferase [Oscillospiraceae bacterium]|nr:GNAT family N-acetyltransferase [Oscillospiraceae bacterium]
MIRPVKISDVSRIAEIHVFGWRCAYKGIVSDDFLFNKMLVSKQISYFSVAILNNIEESYVFDDGIIKAFLTIGACRDEDKSKTFELWGIYVDPFMKRQGIGSKMVHYCERIAIQRRFDEVCLWVLEKNINARKFYEKLGYFPDGKRKFIEPLDVIELRYSNYIRR